MTRLVLASSSETRQRMLTDAGVAFEVRPPAKVDEEGAKADLLKRGSTPSEVAGALAELKALSSELPDALILGSDQVLELSDGTMLSKARSPMEAADQLRMMAGQTHRLHSAAVLAQDKIAIWQATETVRLTMRPITDRFLRDYLDREWGAVSYNVGCYRIEGLGVQLFEAIEGSHFAILGMPLLPLLAELRRRGVLAS